MDLEGFSGDLEINFTAQESGGHNECGTIQHPFRGSTRHQLPHAKATKWHPERSAALGQTPPNQVNRT
jgi:hypothetical protein